MAKITYQLNNKTYYEVYVQGRDPRGKRIQKRTRFTPSGLRISSKQTAKQVEYRLKRELEEILKGTCLWTWEKWHEECLRRMILTHKKSTLLGYDGNVKKWIPKEWLTREMTDFQKVHIHNLLFEDLAGKLSPRGKHNILKSIQRFFEMAVEEGIISRNPAKGIKVKLPQKKQAVLSIEEVNKLLTEAKFCGHRYYPLWTFALSTGMRNGEMYALRHSDVDLKAGLIHITKQFTSKDGIHETKGNENRIVPISDELRPFLLQLMKGGGFEETLWYWSNDKKEEMVRVVWDDLLLPRQRDWRSCEQAKVLRDFCRAIGITEVKFHDLRASFITNMLAQGVPITIVMKVVGHSRMSTTDEYNRLAGIDIKGSTNKLGYHLPNELPFNGKVVSMFKGSG